MRFVSPTGFPTPGLAADAVVLRAAPEGADVLLVRRGREPFEGAWALPGGFVDVGETTAAAAARECAEETGVEAEPVDLLGVYDDPARDPRGHVVGVAWVCRFLGGDAAASDDAAEARWFAVSALPTLAFDHARILDDARAWLAAGGEAMLAP